MPIRAFVYMSEASGQLAGDKFGLASSKLDQIIDDAARFNLDACVTGVLLFDGVRFLQYLEGPDDGVRVAYARVLGASSHSEVVELQRGTVGQRRLPFWPMRWLPVDPDLLKVLVRADWTGFAQRSLPGSSNATGMDLLHQAVGPYANAA
nr:BLUF domain-containing protein [Stenotrophomonas geniculata]